MSEHTIQDSLALLMNNPARAQEGRRPAKVFSRRQIDRTFGYKDLSVDAETCQKTSAPALQPDPTESESRMEGRKTLSWAVQMVESHQSQASDAACWRVGLLLI
jgi:hypothetical protein